jgi:hypothetical protein
LTNGRRLLVDAPWELRDDNEVAFAAVRTWGFNFEFVSEELRDNRELALIAVQCLGGGIFESGFLSERLRGDREILLQALQHPNPGAALALAAEDLRHDKQLLLEVVRSHGDLIHQAPVTLQADPDVLKAARIGFMAQVRRSRGGLGECRCCGGIEPPLPFYADKEFIMFAEEQAELRFVAAAFRLNPELKSDELFIRSLMPFILVWDGMSSTVFEGFSHVVNQEHCSSKKQYSCLKSIREYEFARNILRRRSRREHMISKTKRLDRSRPRGGRHKTILVVDDWHF